MPLARLREPFDHPDWIHEPKLDGFRAIAYIEADGCRLVSRNGNRFKSFGPLCDSIRQQITAEAILDGEIVCLGDNGRPQFYDLMRRREPQWFYAFDLLWRDGRDLRRVPSGRAETAPAGSNTGRGSTTVRRALQQRDGAIPASVQPRPGGHCRKASNRAV
jgi:hypothetical protein